MIAVGALTTGVIATVDEQGRVSASGGALEWRVHAGGGWIDPAATLSARHTRPGVAPTAETAVRIPGGEAVQRVYAVGDAGGVVVVDVENASPDAIGVGFVAPLDRLVLPREPGAVEDGMVVFPLPHRQRIRVALGDPERAVRALPDLEAVARGWDAVLERGMRVELPATEQWEIDAARIDALLAAPSPGAFVALEDWGFDDEAAAMWERMTSRDRRAARRRSADTGLLGAARAALLREAGADIDLLPGFRPQWLGANLAVHRAPMRRGEVSFALRWHGPRPALLWDVPAGSRLRVPALDGSWSSGEPTGETLLSEPPRRLLPMGARTHAEGAALADAPESFS